MATSSKSKQANAAAEAHSALTNRMADAQQVLGEALSAEIAYNLTRPFKHGKAY